jgi:hypothetical protein
VGLEFIDRSLRTTGLLLLIFMPFGVYYAGFWTALAIFSGGVWSILNLIFISALVRATINPEGVDKRKALGLAVFKFPLLYGAGYFLAVNPRFDPIHVLIGFSALFAVMLLKAVGGSMARAVDRPQAADKAGSVA